MNADRPGGLSKLEAELVQYLSGLEEDHALILEVAGTGRYLQVVACQGWQLHGELSSNTSLGEADQLSPQELEVVRGLGWLEPEPGGCPNHFWEAEGPGAAAALARRFVETLAKLMGVSEAEQVRGKAVRPVGGTVQLPPFGRPLDGPAPQPSQGPGQEPPKVLVHAGQRFQFWDGEHRGLIRRRGSRHPEIWHSGRWWFGSAYVMDAITGMGPDPYSCGSWASDLTVPEAQAMDAKLGVDLLAENPDERRPAQRPPGRAG